MRIQRVAAIIVKQIKLIEKSYILPVGNIPTLLQFITRFWFISASTNQANIWTKINYVQSHWGQFYRMVLSYSLVTYIIPYKRLSTLP